MIPFNDPGLNLIFMFYAVSIIFVLKKLQYLMSDIDYEVKKVSTDVLRLQADAERQRKRVYNAKKSHLSHAGIRMRMMRRVYADDHKPSIFKHRVMWRKKL